MSTINRSTMVLQRLQDIFPPCLAGIINGYAHETSQETIARIEGVIMGLNAYSDNKPTFVMQSGTFSRAAQEQGSVGLRFPDRPGYGLTARCTYFGMGPEMTNFFTYLAKDVDITSFMPKCFGGGQYLKGADPAIANCLRENRTLEALDIHCCYIGEEGLLNIVNALEKNSSLKYLNICANKVTNAVLARLLEIVTTHNRVLVCCTVTQNDPEEQERLDGPLIQRIGAQLQANARATKRQ